MPTTDQLMVTIAAELEFPSSRRSDDPMYVPPARAYNEKRKEYDKKYKAANKKKIKEQRKARA